MFRIFTYYLLGILIVASVRINATPVLRYDSSVVQQVRPPQEREQDVFSEVDLGFAKAKENKEENLMSRFWRWILEEIFGDESADSRRTLQQIFLWVLVAAGLILAIRLFRKSDFGSFLKGNTKGAEFNFSDVEEDISQIDFNAKIQQAKRDGDLRLAIRWLYLKQLFLLNEGTKIVFQPYKTNMDYANELSGSPLRKPFREVSRIYEYVWYGDYPMDETGFIKAEAEFAAFEKQIHV